MIHLKHNCKKKKKLRKLSGLAFIQDTSQKTYVTYAEVKSYYKEKRNILCINLELKIFQLFLSFFYIPLTVDKL